MHINPESTDDNNDGNSNDDYLINKLIHESMLLKIN